MHGHIGPIGGEFWVRADRKKAVFVKSITNGIVYGVRFKLRDETLTDEDIYEKLRSHPQLSDFPVAEEHKTNFMFDFTKIGSLSGKK